MKALLPIAPIVLSATIFLCGCGGSSSSTPSTNAASSANVTPANAAGQYVGGLANAQNRAVKTVDTASLNEAVQMYYAQEGKFPPDLNALVQAKLIDHIPDPPRGMKIVYDASTGQVSVVNAQ